MWLTIVVLVSQAPSLTAMDKQETAKLQSMFPTMDNDAPEAGQVSEAWP